MMETYLDNVFEVDLNYNAQDLLERNYLDKIDDLKRLSKKYSHQDINRYKELIDYYTIWVHQIKTPIAALKLILDENKDLKAMSELIRIEEYVEMVLSYLKVLDRDSDYVFKEVDLDKIINENIKYFKSTFIYKKIKINYTKVEYKFLSDEKWLSFIIGQILSNSLKYTKANGEIKIYMQDNILYIEDNGIGIKSDDLPRIFDKGYSGSVGRTYKRATGIGLYLSKKIADILDIEIKITSTINEGTKVGLVLHDNKRLFD